MLKKILFALAMCCLLFTACNADTEDQLPSSPSETNDTTPTQTKDILWEIDSSCGGYAFETDSMRATFAVNGGYQYISIHFTANDHMIQVYFAPTENIVLNTQNGVTTYYLESVADEGYTYTNPMIPIIDGMKHQDFSLIGETILNDSVYMEWCAEETVQKQTNPTTEYTLYTIQTKWVGEVTYLFQYQVFADGATRLVGNAPEEIAEGNSWCIDLDEMQICDTASNVAIPMNIVATATGTGVSPWTEERITVETQCHTYLYTDPNTGRIEKFQFVKDTPGALVTVLHTAEIVRPEITDDMITMDTATLESVLSLASMLEYLFE